MMMIPFAIFGALFSALASKLHPGICKISKAPLMSFLKLMAVVTAVRIIGFYLNGIPTQVNHEVIKQITPLMTLGVFWEDAVFTLPILVLERYGLAGPLKYLLICLSSLVFASGHLAYGPLWAFITLFYVPFISYRLGKKHGLGTVMAGHVLYDLITVLTLKALW